VQVGVYRKVAKRFAGIMQRGLAQAFREWRDYTIDMRAANNRAYDHLRKWVVLHTFTGAHWHGGMLCLIRSLSCPCKNGKLSTTHPSLLDTTGLHRVTQFKFLLAWRETAAVMHERTLVVTEAAEDFLFTRTAGRVLGAWLQEVSHGQDRRAALTRVFESQVKAERKVGNS
jgi:hypothetical protein